MTNLEYETISRGIKTKNIHITIIINKRQGTQISSCIL